MATSAETETAPTESESSELRALKEIKQLKESFAALMPKGEREDKGTVAKEEGETIAGALLVHHAMRSVAEQLAQKVKDAAVNGARVLVIRSLDQASQRFVHQLVLLRLDELASRAESLLASMEQPPTIEKAGQPAASDQAEDDAGKFAIAPVTIGGLAAMAGVAVDLLVSTSQSNLTIREKAVEVKRSALIAPVVDRLLDKKLTVLIDETAALSGDNVVLVALAGLLKKRDELAASAAWMRSAMVEGDGATRIAELTEHIKSIRAKLLEEEDQTVRQRLEADLEKAVQARATLQDALNVAKHKADLADGVVGAINEYVVAITTATETSPAPLLTASFQAEIKEQDLLLFIESATAGGGSLWKKSVGPDKALHQGGTAVSWMLSTGSGVTKAAGVEIALSSQNSKPDESANLREAVASTITT